MNLTGLALTLFVCATAVQAQEGAAAGTPAGRVIGEVTSVDAAARQIALKSDKGEIVGVSLTDKTLYLRVPPGEKDLKKASRINLSDISSGDRVLARGQVSPDQKNVAATAVIVMSKADIAQMHQRRREEWQQRGVVGMVASIDPDGKRFVIDTRTREGLKPLTVEVTSATQIWRYAPDSIKFSDAKPGAFGEMQTGDQARVLGEKDASGSSIKAEQVVSGTFKQVAGTVNSVDAQKGEIRITDLASKKPLVVVVNPDSVVKKLPPMIAAGMARRLNPAAAETAGGGARGERPSGGAPGGGFRPAGEGRGGPGGGDMQQLMERIPTIALTDLKPGDAIIVSSTKGSDPARLTAISVVAGVEPLLTAAPERAINFGGWNFGEIGLPQ